MPQPIVIVDACVLLNLLASEKAEDILHAFDHQYLISEKAAEESLFLRVEDSDPNPFKQVTLDNLVQIGLLKLCAPENLVEDAHYVNLASELRGDGEAMSIAIAHARGYKIATDDRKARGVFLKTTQDTSRLHYTSDLVRAWAEKEAIATLQLQETLLKIRQRATFFPPKRDPNHAWWMRFLVS